MFLIKPNKPNVVNPETGAPLVETGIKIELLDSYWFRRGQDGDVTITEIPAPGELVEVDPPAEKLNKKKGV